MMLNCFGIDKLHGFMLHSVMLGVGRIYAIPMAQLPDLNTHSLGVL